MGGQEIEKKKKERGERVVVELTPQKNKRIKDGKKHNTKKQCGLLYLEEPLHTFSFYISAFGAHIYINFLQYMPMHF